MKASLTVNIDSVQNKVAETRKHLADLQEHLQALTAEKELHHQMRDECEKAVSVEEANSPYVDPELRRAERRLHRLLTRLELAARRKMIMKNMPLSRRTHSLDS